MNLKRKWKRYVFLFVVIFITSKISFSQHLSTQGTEFYVSFMKNGYRCNPSYLNWKLTVIATSPRACQVTVTNPNTGWTATGNVPANGRLSISVPDNQGYHYQSEIVEQKGLKVTATDTISLFIANEATNSFDASIILPTPVLSNNYFVQNYTPSSNSACSDTNGSVFLIVATENNTMVDITPTATTIGGHLANIPFTILLNEGESYQVISGSSGVLGDFSGTKVEARDCKKIALFNGTVLTGIPAGMTSGYDHIFEQAIPPAYWGQKFVITSSLTRSGDMVKLMALQNGTIIKKDGVTVATVNAGSFYEFFLSATESACFLEASAPCAVHLYQTTYGFDNAVDGDPSMVWITPVEQQIKEIVFSTFNAQSIAGHYINIVTPAAATGSIRLDNSNIGGQFTPLVSNPGYSYAKVMIDSGVHHLQSDTGFTAHVYGFGYTQGYAYSVGSMAIELDRDISLNGTASNLLPGNQYYCLNDSILFEVITNYAIESVTWDFGDGSDTVIRDMVKHPYSQPGSYTVTAVIERQHVDCLGHLLDTISYTIHIPDLRDTIRDTVCVGTFYNQFGFSFIALRDTVMQSTVPALFGCDSTYTLYLKVNPIHMTVLIAERCKEDPYYFNGQWRDTAGTYYDTLPNRHGCDSMLMLHLSIYNPSATELSRTICYSDSIYFGGVYLHQTGSYSDTLTGAFNCDSVIVFHLTVLGKNEHHLYDSICVNEGYTSHGFVIPPHTISGSYQYQRDLVSALGCDSTVILYLTVSDIYEQNLYDTNCVGESYMLNGFNIPPHTTAGTFQYQRDLVSALGCDSIIRLTLLVPDAYEQNLYDTVCIGDPYALHGFTIPPHVASGGYQYQRSLTSLFGCDSIVNLHLEVVPSYEEHTNVTICYADSFYFGGNYLNQTGIYQDTLTSWWNCDSVIVLHLEVLAKKVTDIYDATCVGKRYTSNGFDIPPHNSAGLYQYERTIVTLPCDSTVILHLQVWENYEEELYDKVCIGEHYLLYGFTIPPHTSSGIYQYKKTFTSSHGCDSIVTLHLEVPDVHVKITSSADDFCKEKYTVLTANTQSFNFLWNTGETTPSIAVEAPGNYSVTVSEEGCIARDAMVIEKCPFALYLPNAITPGRPEGLNDFFFLANTNQVTDLEIYIYSRWGELIFYSKDIYFKWDGSVKGQIMYNQTYHYILQVRTSDGELHKTTGTITVL